MKRLSLIVAVLAVVALPMQRADAVDKTKVTVSADKLATAKAKCDAAVQKRQTSLDSLTDRLSGAKHVHADHKSALDAEVQSTKSGLTALNATIQSDSSAKTLAADCKKIASDYRVYLVVMPKVHEIVAADALHDAADSMHKAVPGLTKQLNAAEHNGKDVTDAKAALADLIVQSDAVTQGVDGLYGPLLTLQPSGYPGNRTTVTSSRQSLGDYVKDAKKGRTDLQTIQSALSSS